MASSPWEISMAEWDANNGQFASLGPINGKATGEAVRGLLLKSGLPPQTLAQIWGLSDIDKDGLLDAREFSIAMKLTRNCLSGVPLPPQLPPSMYNVPSGTPSATMTLGRPTPPNMQPLGIGVSPPVGGVPLPGMSHGPLGGLSQPIGNLAQPMPVMSQPLGMTQSGMGLPLGGTPLGGQFPVYHTAPAGSMGSAAGTPAGSSFAGRQCGNWAVPQPQKLKFSQQFNQLDKGRTGFLAGGAARNAMGQSGLPTTALAHIWNLSDINKDGRLSVDEFCIAMHLIDMHKGGYALPQDLPPELAAISHSLQRMGADSPHLEPGAPPAQKSPAPKTFEDKRRDNFDRGQAELDRRRQILLDEENRRRAELEKKEREEREMRERERQEQERRREMERQAEMERQRILEEQRMEAEKKRLAEMERQRVEQEKTRKKQLLERRKAELEKQKEHAAEKLATQQQKHKTLQFQLQALDEKTVDMTSDMTKARDTIETITREIEGMRMVRDEKLKSISEAQNTCQQLCLQSEQLSHQLLQLQGANRDATQRATELEELRRKRDQTATEIEELKKEVEETKEKHNTQRENADAKKSEIEQKFRPTLEKVKRDHAEALRMAEQLKRQLQELLAADQASAFAAAAPPPPVAPSSPPQTMSALPSYDTPPVIENGGHHESVSGNGPLPSSGHTVKYRAIYAFDARSEDELSFHPGDVILVFEGHASEPGWLAGQIKEKVGWFPQAFAEPIAPVNPNVTSPMQTVPSNVTPSPSLEKILEEPMKLENNNEVSSPMVASFPSNETVLCTCTAQFPWKARNQGDLTFAKGDTIEVLERTEMKWRGRKRGDNTVGWFPKSYVKVTEEGSAGQSSSMSRHPSEATPVSTPSAAPTNNIPNSPSVHSMSSQNGKVNGTSSGEWYVAVYDFDAVEPTDLPLKTGDRILILERNEDWWKGQCNGREGIFPANYVQPASASSHAPVVPSSTSSDALTKQRGRVIAPFQATGDNQISLKLGDVVLIRSRSDAGWWEGEIVDENGQNKVGWFPGDYVSIEGTSKVTSPASGSVMVAMFDYEASQADELSFKTGEQIVVTAQSDPQWWSGYRSTDPSRTGLFPANYVQAR